MSETAEKIENEWSCVVKVSDLADGVQTYHIAPDDEEKARLARRLGLISLDQLEADLKVLQNMGNHVVQIEGRFKGLVTQECVVSGDPVQSEAEDSFEAWYADPEQAVLFSKAKREQKMKKGHVEMPILDESEDPEPIVNGEIDLGELVTQHLSLAINPYPHAPGAEYEKGDDEPDGTGGRIDNPFAALKDWKKQMKEE